MYKVRVSLEILGDHGLNGGRASGRRAHTNSQNGVTLSAISSSIERNNIRNKLVKLRDDIKAAGKVRMP